ncbi:MAG: cell division protein FtsA [Wenyingzhuangia sp.]|jgi:cell division protein FtsA|uniref:cell division protein FtsA n=1 Tax=Wenyingzhuangia sp. TaxID=1964193 RepID=UPI00321B5B11
MENNRIAIGLDIGTTKIVAMIGSENEYGKIEVLGIGKAKSLGVKRGVVNNITQTIQSIQQAVEEAENISGLKIDTVTVGIAGHHIRSIHHSDYITRQDAEDVIEEKDIDHLISQVHTLVMLPGEEIIHVLPQDFKVDSQADISEPVGMYGGRLEANFHVVVGQVSQIKNIGRCVTNSGLGLSSITLEPLASAEAVLSDEEKEAGVALIDIGGGTTDLAIFKDGVIRHTAVIPFGGNVVTNDIKEGLQIIEKQAELLKLKFGSAWPGENKENEIVSIPGLRGREPKEITLRRLSEIIHSRVSEIIEQVYLEIKNHGHESQNRKLIAGIVLTGGGAQVKHLKQLVEYITGMDTRIGYPNEHLAGGSDESLSSPVFATAVGLLMKGLENIKKEELEDPDFEKVEEKIEEAYEMEVEQEPERVVEQKKTISKKSWLDKFTSGLKDFLNEAE